MYPSSLIRRRYCAAALLVATLAGAGCQAWHTEGVRPDSLLAARHLRGLRVTRTNGSRMVLESPIVRADTLSGLVSRDGGQQQVQIPLADVQRVETLRLSGGRTAGLLGGLALGVVATYAIAIAIACSNGACSN
jgi:hypothetical protein